MQGSSLAVKCSDFLFGESILLFSGLDLLILWNEPKTLQGLSLNTHSPSLKNSIPVMRNTQMLQLCLIILCPPTMGHTFPVTESPVFKRPHSEESSNLPSNNCSRGPSCHSLLKMHVHPLNLSAVTPTRRLQRQKILKTFVS